MNRIGSARAVALVAELIDVGNIQQPGILRAMWCVAARASLALDHCMLKHPGAACLRVALGADHVLVSCGPHIVRVERAVSVVAVGALHQAFVHLVMEWHAELRLDVGVALVAKLRLRGLQQFLFGVARVHAMATRATYAALGMRRTLKVRMRASVAAQAGLVDLLHRQLADLLNLGYVAAAFDVGLAATMAAFARRALAAMRQGTLGVRIRLKLLGYLCMAGRANIRADKISRILCLDFGSSWGLLRTTRRVSQPSRRNSG